MSGKNLLASDALARYIVEHSRREASILEQLRHETATLPGARMQTTSEQGQFLALLVKLIGARRILEIGVFTGYSSLSMALAMPSDGRLIACDVDPETTAVAQRYWQAAGVADRIELRLAPARDTLARLREHDERPFDMVFIDADKQSYRHYYENALALTAPGGLIVVDNVLWSGRVADHENDAASTRAIRTFNEMVRDDERVDISIIPIGDGLTLARKR